MNTGGSVYRTLMEVGRYVMMIMIMQKMIKADDNNSQNNLGNTT
jgi:hypothetical protein